MSELIVGAQAPAFSAPDQSGKTVSLSDFKGKKVVLYFYPKDDTPGCTVRLVLSATSTRIQEEGRGRFGRKSERHEIARQVRPEIFAAIPTAG